MANAFSFAELLSFELRHRAFLAAHSPLLDINSPSQALPAWSTVLRVFLDCFLSSFYGLSAENLSHPHPNAHIFLPKN